MYISGRGIQIWDGKKKSLNPDKSPLETEVLHLEKTEDIEIQGVSVDRGKGKGFLDDEKGWIMKSMRKERRDPKEEKSAKKKKSKNRKLKKKKSKMEYKM